MSFDTHIFPVRVRWLFYICHDAAGTLGCIDSSNREIAGWPRRSAILWCVPEHCTSLDQSAVREHAPLLMQAKQSVVWASDFLQPMGTYFSVYWISRRRAFWCRQFCRLALVPVLRKDHQQRFKTNRSSSSYWHQAWVGASRHGFASLLLLTHRFYQSAFESNRSRQMFKWGDRRRLPCIPEWEIRSHGTHCQWGLPCNGRQSPPPAQRAVHVFEAKIEWTSSLNNNDILSNKQNTTDRHASTTSKRDHSPLRRDVSFFLLNQSC